MDDDSFALLRLFWTTLTLGTSRKMIFCDAIITILDRFRHNRNKKALSALKTQRNLKLSVIPWTKSIVGLFGSPGPGLYLSIPDRRLAQRIGCVRWIELVRPALT